MKWDQKGPWNPEAVIHPGLGLRKGKLDRREPYDIQRVIVHHTGVGILGRFARDKQRFGWHDPVQAATHVYTRIMSSSGHYVIGHHGELIQYVPESWTAWHAGYGNKRKRSLRASWFDRWKYSRKDAADKPLWLCNERFAWWDLRWYKRRGICSPTHWFPELDVNRHTIGIELLSTPGKAPFHPEQLAALRKLIDRLRLIYQIPVDEDHILTHSDACPLARTTKSGIPYDPPPDKWSFWTHIIADGSHGVNDLPDIVIGRP